MLAEELVHCPQENVQAGIGGRVFCAECVPEGVTPAAASCKLLLQASVPHHSATEQVQVR